MPRYEIKKATKRRNPERPVRNVVVDEVEQFKSPVEINAANKQGVLFWHPARADGPDQQPQFFIDPSLAPPHAVFGSSIYSRVEYPVGSGQMLRINRMARIADRDVIVYLIVNAAKPASGGISGNLYYDPQEILDQDWMTEDELDQVERGINPFDSEAYAPPPDFGLMSDAQLHEYARNHGVDLDPTVGKVNKERVLQNWFVKMRGKK